MAIDSMSLPTDETAICRLLDEHCIRENIRLSVRRTFWLFAYYYLNGARRFDTYNPNTGLIIGSTLDEEGNMEFQSQELLTAINRTAGRIAGMDLAPRISRNDFSMSGIKDRAVAQVIADSIISSDQLEKAKTQFAYLFTCLGSAGITGHLVDHPTIGLTTDLEVIHPREIYPFPSLGQDYTKVRGLVRERVVPLSYLKDKFGKARIEKRVEDMEWWRAPYGMTMDRTSGDLTSSSVSVSPYKDYGGKYSVEAEKMEQEVAVVRELWLTGPRDTCIRYICTSGMLLLDDQDFTGQEVYCPIGFERFFENGTFHGAGVFDTMFPISRELERLNKSLFNNIRDTDRYGFLVMPAGSWNERAALREVGKGLRVLPWEPDPMTEGFRPFAVQPFNLGDVPGKVAAFAQEQMDRINPFRDLLKEKGRVDSMAGLQFLDEQVMRAVTTPSRGVQAAFGQAYRACVSQSRVELLTSPRPLPVSKLTLDLAGVVIDPEKNTVQFVDNPLPNLSRLSFGVKETSPRSMVARKTELVELAKMGPQLIDPDRFMLTALTEGLDFAMWSEDYAAAYAAVVRNCLLLYRDGETPGEVVITPHTVRPDFQLKVLNAFMQKPEMGMASPQVQDAFKTYQETLLQWTGASLPEGTPNPDEAAMQSQMMMEQAQQAQMAQQPGQIQGPQAMPVR